VQRDVELVVVFVLVPPLALGVLGLILRWVLPVRRSRS
jgi:hypothetical protein